MKLNFIKPIFLTQLCVLLFSCGGGGDDSPEPTPPTPVAEIPDPKAATLIFPENNTECNTGVIASDTSSNVTFMWNEAEDTSSYEINTKNLTTGVANVRTSNTNEVTLAINRGTPYEWFVISKANGTTVTATSAVFKFYNEGPGISNYAPFPAEAVFPSRGANLESNTTEVSLAWSASDVDEDIVSYEVYLDTEEDPTTLIGSPTASELPNIVVASGTTYRWKVITLDGATNSSTSEIFEFSVN